MTKTLQRITIMMAIFSMQPSRPAAMKDIWKMKVESLQQVVISTYLENIFDGVFIVRSKRNSPSSSHIVKYSIQDLLKNFSPTKIKEIEWRRDICKIQRSSSKRAEGQGLWNML